MFTHKMAHIHTQDNTCAHTRWHTSTHKRWHTSTHKMAHVHIQDNACSHTRRHTFTHKVTHVHKNAVLFSYSNNQFTSFQIPLFLYVINKQGTVFFNLTKFLPHIMPLSIKNFEISPVHIIYSMVYTVSALLSCFQY